MAIRCQYCGDSYSDQRVAVLNGVDGITPGAQEHDCYERQQALRGMFSDIFKEKTDAKDEQGID
jgi:hypothetical protein